MKKFYSKRLTLMVVLALVFIIVAYSLYSGNGESSKEVAATPVTIKIYMNADVAESEVEKKLHEAFTAKTGIQVAFDIIPGNDIYKKVDRDLASSVATTDVIPLTNPLVLDKYVKNDYLLPLNKLMQESNYDAERIYGKYLTKYDGNTIYSLPESVSVWAVFYNKKIFDDANVPYPPDEWTWTEYIDTAKKLTNLEKGIYGSYMLDYDTYMFMLARQHNISAYKADGTSNYDDPIFKESLKLFNHLGNVAKIQPSWLDFKSKKLAWNEFMSGKYGMHLIGNWYTGLFTNTKDYPRDWQWGVTQIPTDGIGMNNFGVTYTHGVNKLSAHPKEALEYVKFKAENTAKMIGVIPALADPIAQKETLNYIADASNGSVTVDDLSKAFFDNKLGYVSEKNVGPATAEYSDIILRESDLYLIGVRSLDETIQTIKDKANVAIQKERK